MQVEAAQGHLRLATCWVLRILAFTNQNQILLCESSPNPCSGFVTPKVEQVKVDFSCPLEWAGVGFGVCGGECPVVVKSVVLKA